MKLKQHWKWLLPLLLVPLVIIAGTDPSNVFRLGNKAASNKRIILDRGGSNPEIRWNEATSQMQVSNDGSVFSDLPGAAPQGYGKIENLEISTSVAANALTIAVKTANGSDPSASDVVRVGFRSSTASSGAFTMRELTSALSLTISSGSTLGHSSSSTEPIYVYLLDNSGTLELVAGTTAYDDGFVRSTTAEGGAGGADSRYTLYSATTRSNMPVRLVARLFSTQTTAGTWATSISDVSLWPFYFTRSNQLYQEMSASSSTALPGQVAISSNSCASLTAFTSTSLADVTCGGSTVNVTVVGTGRPIEVWLQPSDGNIANLTCYDYSGSDGACTCHLGVSVNGSDTPSGRSWWGIAGLSSNAVIKTPAGGFRWLFKNPGQGTFTFVLRGLVASSDRFDIQYVQLMAREL